MAASGDAGGLGGGDIVHAQVGQVDVDDVTGSAETPAAPGRASAAAAVRLVLAVAEACVGAVPPVDVKATSTTTGVAVSTNAGGA